jgi:hypothetical protein
MAEGLRPSITQVLAELLPVLSDSLRPTSGFIKAELRPLKPNLFKLFLPLVAPLTSG